MSNERKLRTCVICGIEFMGFNSAKYCPVCRAMREEQTAPELADEKPGWRHMFRDRTGTVIVPGGNVMTALDDLCAYEEACEEAGIRGPEELKAALEELGRLRKDGRTPPPAFEGRSPSPASRGGCGGRQGAVPTQDGGTGWYDPHAKRDRRTQGKHCEGCGHYHPTIASGARGICDKHPRRVRPEGGKRGKYVVLDEPRVCQARRVACSDWEAKETRGPGDPAPTRDGGADCHGKRGGQGKREQRQQPGGLLRAVADGYAGSDNPCICADSGRPTPRNDNGGDGGQGSGRPTWETPPEWVGPSAELKQKEGS